jgi:RHS repeat-associated protein
VLATNQWLSEPETVSNFVSNIDISNLNNTTENWILASFGSGKAINSEINILVNKLDVAIGKEFSGDVPTPTGVSLEKSNNLVFEIKDHLGNVRATFSPNNLDMLAGTQTYDVTSLTDYYPFGMIMPGRSFNTGDYRYGGAGGQEMDNEISGVGNSYTAEYWQYDPRLGRRWNIDPVTYPWQSSYATFNNNPIYFVDPQGLEGTGGGDDEEIKSSLPSGNIPEVIGNKRQSWFKKTLAAVKTFFNPKHGIDISVQNGNFTKPNGTGIPEYQVFIDLFLAYTGLPFKSETYNPNQKLGEVDIIEQIIDTEELDQAVEEVTGLKKSVALLNGRTDEDVKQQVNEGGRQIHNTPDSAIIPYIQRYPSSFYGSGYYGYSGKLTKKVKVPEDTIGGILKGDNNKRIIK